MRADDIYIEIAVRRVGAPDARVMYRLSQFTYRNVALLEPHETSARYARGEVKATRVRLNGEIVVRVTPRDLTTCYRAA